MPVEKIHCPGARAYINTGMPTPAQDTQLLFAYFCIMSCVAFVDKTERDCRAKLKDDFDTFTNIIDWELLSGLNDLSR